MKLSRGLGLLLGEIAQRRQRITSAQGTPTIFPKRARIGGATNCASGRKNPSRQAADTCPAHNVARRANAARNKQLVKERKAEHKAAEREADEHRAAEAASQEPDSLDDELVTLMASIRLEASSESDDGHTPFGSKYSKIEIPETQLESHRPNLTAIEPIPVNSGVIDDVGPLVEAFKLTTTDPEKTENQTLEPEATNAPFPLDVPTYAEPEFVEQQQPSRMTEFRCPLCLRVFERIKFLNHPSSSTTRTYVIIKKISLPFTNLKPIINPLPSPTNRLAAPLSTSVRHAPVPRRPHPSQDSFTTTRVGSAA